MFTITKGSYSFDISLKILSKSIGDYPDQTPLFSGFLMGVHKMRYYFTIPALLVDITKVAQRQKSFIRSLMYIQFELLLFLFLYYLYTNMEDLYLSVFMLAGSKCLAILLYEPMILITEWKLSKYDQMSHGHYNKVKNEEKYDVVIYE